jgi:hypothetical protein
MAAAEHNSFAGREIKWYFSFTRSPASKLKIEAVILEKGDVFIGSYQGLWFSTRPVVGRKMLRRLWIHLFDDNRLGLIALPCCKSLDDSLEDVMPKVPLEITFQGRCSVKGKKTPRYLFQVRHVSSDLDLMYENSIFKGE